MKRFHDAARCPVASGATSGALLAAATSPLPLGWLALVALAPLIRTAIAGDLRQAARAGFACGLVFFGAGFLWVPWNVGGVFWPAWVLGVPALAAPVAALAAAVAAIRRRFGVAAACAIVPALWALLELVRALGPFGIGWLRLGHALAPWPVWIQLASLGGVGLVSAWAAALGASLAYASETRRAGALAVPLALFAIGTGWGAAQLAFAPAPISAPIRVAAIQPAVPASQRFVASQFQSNLARLLALSEAALADAPDLVVWPEGAFEQSVGAAGAPFLGSVASTLGVPLVSGARRVAAGDVSRRWNSALLATPDGDTRVAADKQRPLPIHERAPDTVFAAALARLGAWPGRVRAGAPAEPVSVVTPGGAGLRVGAVVCIDAVFPEIARGLRARGAELLVHIANEAESGRWSARQHALLVRLRAVETRLPLVRVANDGPSAWIDAYGREIARVERGAAAATVALGGPGPAPPYVRLGDAPVVASLFVPFLLCAAGGGRDRLARRRRIIEEVLES